VGCGMAGKACGSGNMLATMLADRTLWACCAVGSHPQSHSRAACTYIARCLRVALPVPPSFVTWFLSSHFEGCARPKMSVAVLVCMSQGTCGQTDCATWAHAGMASRSHKK
jgi:hypothetical protein